MKSSRRIVPAVILFLCCLAHALYAAPPKTISYQGYLKDGTGKPVTAATNLTFRLYSSTRAESGAFWVEPRSVTPANGVYSVELGTSAPMDPLTFDRQYFLGVTVESGSEMTPRQPLTSAPYAIRARIANSVALGSIGTAAISDNSVTTVKIATGAVTDAQISGTISAGKLDLSGVQEKYGKVAVVAQSGGDYTDVISPMIQLATWCGTPSSTNRCLIKIMPGVYDITADVLFMHQYVDIEGSGENTTVITGTISNDSSPPAYGVVNGADNAEIRFLTIKNTATSGSHQAALVNSGTSPKMTFLTTNATGTGGGSHYGVSNISSSPTMSNITATGAGATNYNYGVRNYSSSPIMSNIMATGAGGNSSYGVYNSVSSSPTMSNVTASASGGSESLGVYNSSSSSPTMSHVTASGAGATASNYGVQNYSSSPTMIDVTATGSGGNWAYGVYNNNSSSPTMSNVTATASGGATYNYGVNNYISSPTMSNVTVTASGAGISIGVYNSGSSSPTMSNVTARGNNYGLYNNGTSGPLTILIDRSSFEGANRCITNDVAFTLKIGASKLSGGATNALGTYTCVGVYDGDTYSALSATCK